MCPCVPQTICIVSRMLIEIRHQRSETSRPWTMEVNHFWCTLTIGWLFSLSSDHLPLPAIVFSDNLDTSTPSHDWRTWIGQVIWQSWISQQWRKGPPAVTFFRKVVFDMWSPRHVMFHARYILDSHNWHQFFLHFICAFSQTSALDNYNNLILKYASKWTALGQSKYNYLCAQYSRISTTAPNNS